MRFTSVGPRSSCAALIAAPHKAFAWVQSTAFGRAVVPEVYCTANGALGSCGRAGTSAGSPLISLNGSTRGDGWKAAGGAPASVAVTEIQRSSAVDCSTILTWRGWVTAPTTLAWVAT